jgi:hypothetical protein
MFQVKSCWHTRVLLTVVAFAVLTPEPTQGWDGKRLGLVLGAGARAGVMKTKYDPAAVAGFELTAGVGVTDQFALLLTAPLVWTHDDSTPEGHSGFALQYWLRSFEPSIYFNVGVSTPGSVDRSFYVGAGREFRKHLSLELGLTIARDKSEEFAFLGKLVVLGY